MQLEEFVEDGAHSAVSGMVYSSLETRYPKEHLAILKELRPARHTAELKRQKRERVETTKANKLEKERARKTLANEKKNWKTLGGMF